MMDSNPLVSVIIPTFNREELLKRAIESVLSQTYQNFEVLIIDNYSQDRTQDIIASFDDSRLKTHFIHNQGIIAKSRNIGIKYSVGDLIAFLDSDDYWNKDKLLKSVTALKNGADITYHNMRIITPIKSTRTNCRKLDPENSFHDLMVNGNTLSTSSVVLNRNKIKDKLFNESLDCVGWEDYELWLRLAKSNNSFYFIDCILGAYAKHDGNFDSSLQVIHNIKNIKKLYITEYERLLSIQVWWVEYTLALAFLDIKNYNKFFYHACQAIWKPSGIIRRMKNLTKLCIKFFKFK